LSITKKIETTRMNASMLLLSALQSGDESRFIAVLDSIEINDLISMRDPTTDATLLHVAADRSLERAIDALLGGKFKNSSLVRAQTREGNIALHFAVRKSGACAAQLLAAWPESLNFLCVNRESPLLYACNAACRSSVALLVSDAFRANVNWFHVAKSGRNCLVALVCASVKSEMSSDAIECIRTIFDNLDDSARRGLLLWTERSRSHSILHTVVNSLAVSALPFILDLASTLGIAKQLLAKTDSAGRTALEVVRDARAQLHTQLTSASPDVQRRFNDALTINLALERKQRELETEIAVSSTTTIEETPILTAVADEPVVIVKPPKAPKAPKPPKQPKPAKAPKAVVATPAPAPKKKQPPAPVVAKAKPIASSAVDIEPGDGWVVVGNKAARTTRTVAEPTSNAVEKSEPIAEEVEPTVPLSPPVESDSSVDSLYEQCVELVNARSALASSLDVLPHHVLGDLAELSMAQIECVEAILESLRHDANQAKMAIVHRLLSIQRRQ
jgi:hypothetical protein